MILTFAKPKQVMAKDEWSSISAEGAPPGVYVSNMSDADRQRWKAKVVGSKSGNPRIEIRSEKGGSNLLVIVNGKLPTEKKVVTYGVGEYAREHPLRENEANLVKMSSNGPLLFDQATIAEFTEAIAEARKVLALLDDPNTVKDTLKLIRAGQHPLERP